MLDKAGIEAHYVMAYEKGGSWYRKYTLDIVCRWLREVHLIFFEFILVPGDGVFFRFRIDIYQMIKEEVYARKELIYGYSYEAVHEAAIRYCLEHLI